MSRLREFLAGVFCSAFSGGMLWAFLTGRLTEPMTAWRYMEEGICVAGVVFGLWVAGMAIADTARGGD